MFLYARSLNIIFKKLQFGFISYLHLIYTGLENPNSYLTEEEATVCMSTNVIFWVRWNTGDSSSDSEEIVDTLEEEVVADRSKISRETGKS